MTEAAREGEADSESAAFVAQRLSRFLSGATLVMVALSWRLWFDQDDFPAIPFVRGWPALPVAWSFVSLVLLVISLGCATLRPCRNAGLVASLIVFALLIPGDQLRLQAWVYHYLVLGTILALLPARETLFFCRMFLIITYVHSGLSKWDYAFAHELGPKFVAAFARLTSLNFTPYVEFGDGFLIYALPLAEILASMLLLWRRTRVVGLIIAVSMHLILIAILGPWSLGHSTIVLLWNAAFIVEDILLFGLGQKQTALLAWPNSGRARFVAAFVLLLGILPFTERLGWFDAWPSHALYASHCERGWITFSESQSRDDRLPYPEPIRRYVSSNNAGTGYLNLFDWCRTRRGVPPYPQNRYLTGVAEWVAERSQAAPAHDVRLILQSPAHPLTGERTETLLDGWAAIRDQASRYRLNAHPRSITR